MKKEYAATIGVFDGVHRGHRKVIECMLRAASERGLGTIVVTFDRNPMEVICPERAPKSLMTLDEKVATLKATGVEKVVVLPFDRRMMETPARDFMLHTLRGELDVRLLVLGYDNRFGKRSPSEDFHSYEAYGCEMGIEVIEGPQPEECGLFEGKAVSSSLVRSLMEEGRRTEAHGLMKEAARENTPKQ